MGDPALYDPDIMSYQSLKGFRDILPAESANWRRIESAIYSLAARYGYGEVRLPIVESTDLFRRGVGEETDIVGKEMYTFLDRSDPPESITLRPELTAGAARAYIQHEIAKSQPVTRWFYIGPMFRYEQPQAGRYRQFFQFGLELYGSAAPDADAEVIAAGIDLLHVLGITSHRLRINSIGTTDERTAYRAALLQFLRQQVDSLSEESRRRMEGNPLRVLDSKRPEDIEATGAAPRILDFLGKESKGHFQRTLDLLAEAGVQASVDHRLVRGLDYYSRTAFEYQGLDLGAQDALGGGGRYDGLIEQLGGDPTPAVGLSFGMDRLVIAMGHAERRPEREPVTDVFFIPLDDDARTWAFGKAHSLRRLGMSAGVDVLGRSMKGQMREANRKRARLAVIIGSNEMEQKTAMVKVMATSEQQPVPFDTIERALVDMLTAIDAD